MFRFLWRLIKFSIVLFLIGMVLFAVGSVLELAAKYWILILLTVILAISVYYFVSYISRKRKRRKILELHDNVEKILSQRSVEQMPSPQSDPVLDSPYLNYGGVEAELLNIDLMEGHAFEYWCAALLENLGFRNVEVTQSSSDDGVDILAEKEGIRYAIQCKRYNSDLGNTPIQEVHTGKAVYNCHVGAVMTNRHFTEGGRRAAAATGTLLWDRDWIRLKIEEAQLAPEESIKRFTNLTYSDHLFPDAVEIVLTTRCAKPTEIQRALNIGYNRACCIIDEMEENGIIGPYKGSKPRDILITRGQWASIKEKDLV